MEFVYNNILFFVQVCFSFFGLMFTMSMLLKGEDPSIYLPIFSSIITLWIPSPTQTLRFPISQPVIPISRHIEPINQPLIHAEPNSPRIIPISRPIFPIENASQSIASNPEERQIVPISQPLEEEPPVSINIV